MDMLAFTPVKYNYWETLSKKFIIHARINELIQEIILNNAAVRRFPIALNRHSAFTGSYAENPIWYQQFVLGQNIILKGSQPIVVFDAADKCQLFFTTMQGMNYHDDISSFPNAIFQDHFVLVIDLSSMQNATDNFHYPKMFKQPLTLELNLTFPLEHVTELNVWGTENLWLQLSSLLFKERTSRIDNVSLQQITNCVPLFKYRYLGSVSPDNVPAHHSETFAISNTQPNIMQAEHWIMIANSREKLYFAVFWT